MGRLGKTGGRVKSSKEKKRDKRARQRARSKSRKTKKDESIKITNIKETIPMTTITDGRTWKGDPTDTAAISAWKQSYEPGYTSQIISPRDSSGNYTSDPKEMVAHAIISKEQQATEIVHSLHGETDVPTSILQTLAKNLGVVLDKVTHKDAPTGITDTTRITGDDTETSRLTEMFKGKISALTIALFIIIFFSLKLYKTK